MNWLCKHDCRYKIISITSIWTLSSLSNAIRSKFPFRNLVFCPKFESAVSRATLIYPNCYRHGNNLNQRWRTSRNTIDIPGGGGGNGRRKWQQWRTFFLVHGVSRAGRNQHSVVSNLRMTLRWRQHSHAIFQPLRMEFGSRNKHSAFQAASTESFRSLLFWLATNIYQISILLPCRRSSNSRHGTEGTGIRKLHLRWPPLPRHCRYL